MRSLVIGIKSVYPGLVMTKRLAILALVALLLPTFMVPGRIAVCRGECACSAARAPQSECSATVVAPRSCCACCSTAPADSKGETDAEIPACRCSTVPGPRRDSRPSCPNCSVFERGFGTSTNPESFDWQCPTLEVIAELLPVPAIFEDDHEAARLRPERKDPRDPPPRTPLPLLI